MNTDFFQRWSLKIKVTVSTLIIFIVSIGLLSSYAGRMLRADIKTMIHDQQFATVSVFAELINSELNSRVRSLETVAGRITPAIFNDPKMLQAFLEERLLLEKLFNSGYLVTNSEGTTIASVPLSANRVGVNFINRSSIALALNKGITSISEPVIGRISGFPVFSIATPIRDGRGTIVGTVAGIVDLSKPSFLSHITDNRYGKTGGYVLIAPQHKVVVAATDRSRVMQPIPAPGVNPLMDRYINGFEGSGSIVDSRGVEVLSSSRQIPGAGWVLVGRIPTAEAYAPIRDMQNRMLISSLVMTLLAGGLIWWLLKRQLSPVFATLKTLSAISDANLPVAPLPVHQEDEVGKLIGGFNRLITALASSKRFLQTIIDSEPECIKMLDSNGNILMMNTAGLKMLDADSFEQVQGQCVFPLVTEQYRDAFIALTKQIYQGIPGKLEFAAVGLKGRRVWLETHAVPFRNEQGEITSLLGIARDITQRKQIEREREEALSLVKKLEGIVPICMYCKKIRTEQDSWQQLEQYISDHSEARFSHGMCPECAAEQLKAIDK
ncbi:MAG: cache domain-containing protein [Desulforhopalus sp.]|nr:cache domain-containing protein [Desulforhopalus sp.]